VNLISSIPQTLRVRLSVIVLFGAAMLPASGGAAIISADPSNYRTVLASLNAGDTMMLVAGTYTSGLPISNKSGTAAQPIVIKGPDDQSAVFTANDCCNTVQLQDVGYLEIRNLTLNGAGTNGAFGVDARGTSHHVTIENLKIINYGGDQQVVGISTKGPAWNWVIRRNTIIGAGTGIYLGNSDGTSPFVNGLIEHNLVVDTIGYNMQIKHQLPRPTNVGLPTGESRTIIRHNVFSKQNNASSGADARPNVLVGHFPLSGAGSTDRYEIYGNFFYQNPVDALFQGEGNIVLHDNVFVNSSGSAVNITSHNDKPRTVTVYHNTVVATGNGIRVANADTAYVQKIIANAVFAATPVSGPNQQGNVTGSYAAAGDYLVAPTAALGSLDLYPKTGQLAGTATDLAQFSGYTDGARDFNGSARTGIHRGAYEGNGSNPGWRLALAIKPASGSTPAPVVNLAADPTTVSLQGSTTLQWTAVNAASCTASGGWSGSRGLSGSEIVGPLSATTTFVLTCTGSGGSDSRTVSVAVANGSPAPTVSITASPASLAVGESTLLAWQSTGSTACEASGGWAGARAASGTETVGPIQTTSAYTLSCTGPGGSATATAAVSVAAAPTLTLQANSTTVSAGQSATLTWSTTGATSCNASGAWAGNLATSGTRSTGALTATSTFVLACSGPGGSITRQVGVAVEAGGGTPAPGGGGGSGGGGGALTPLALLALLALAARRRRPGQLYSPGTELSGHPSG
jgi:hypothetical protein